MGPQIQTKSSPLSLLVSWMWLGYFILTISVIWAILVPVYVVLYPLNAWTNNWADEWMRFGIGFLMRVQPWYRADIDLQLSEGGRGCLLVSNHRSHLDVFILLSNIAGIRVLAKSTLLSIPFLGLMMRLSKQIPVERGNVQSFFEAFEKVKAAVLRGEVVHVFPEFTRCATGFKGTQDFSMAPFHAAIQGGFHVIPIVFSGTDEVWPKSSFGIHFRKRIQVRSLEALNPKDFASSEELMKEARHRIQQGIQQALTV